MTTIVVPALSRDPYAAAVVSGAVVAGFANHEHPGLWVPAQGRDDVWIDNAGS
jgi:hypothetical protein